MNQLKAIVASKQRTYKRISLKVCYQKDNKYLVYLCSRGRITMGIDYISLQLNLNYRKIDYEEEEN